MSSNPLSAFLQNLDQLAAQEPEQGSLTLFVSGKPCGVVSPIATDVLRQLKGIRVGAQSIEIESQVHLSEQLAEVALALHEAGCIPKWRGELLDVWCNDNAIASIERGAVRPLGLLTRAVHLNAWSIRGDLWVARRALNKPTDPGMWDTLVGGLVGYGEPDDLALERESAEEAGLSSAQIAGREAIRSIYRMRRRVPEGFQHEEVLTSDCVLADDVVPQNQDGEVMEIACLPTAQIETMLLAGEFTVEASIVIAQSLLSRQAN